MNNLSKSLEDYLEQIYILQAENTSVRVTDIAVALQISKPSVNRAINTLKEEGYLTHEHYGTVTLTEEGQRAAEGVLEHHKLLKRFLMEFLGVEESIAEEEACQMEHSISKDTGMKLKVYMEKVMNNK